MTVYQLRICYILLDGIIAIMKSTENGTGSSKKMDGNWNRNNLKSTRRIYTFGILKCSEKFKGLDLA
jgi:hypothetical protein